MPSSHPPLVRTRLSMMMFLEFFVWGSWGVAITGYAAKSGFTASEITWLGAVPAIGAIISPLFIGLIADRFLAAQKMLCILHLAGGACLIGAGFCGKYLVETGDPNSFSLLLTLMLFNGLAFMPTIALVNSVAFRHIPDADKFPRIAVLGTVGWIVAVLFASVFLGGAATPNFLFQAGAGGILLAFYCLTLPDTPPKGAEAGGDVFGLKALTLFKQRSFMIFIVCVFLISIPACGFFFTLMMPMLQQRGYPSPLALTSLNQFAELIFMFSMPWFVSKLGLKRVIAIGMAAWAVRYLFFMCPQFSSALIGLVLHGFCYSFFYVGAYMWVDRRAPAELKSSAQSLLAFLLLGVGYLLGAKGLAGVMMEQYPPDLASMVAIEAGTGGQVKDAKLPRWDDPDAEKSAWRYLDLSGTVNNWLKKDDQKDDQKEEKPNPDLAQLLDADKDGTITLVEIEQSKLENVKVDGLAYFKEDLVAVFKSAHEKLELEGDVALNRKQWLAVQSNKWDRIWLWPSIGCFVVLIFFALAFRDEPKKE